MFMTLPAWHGSRGCDERVWIWSPNRSRIDCQCTLWFDRKKNSKIPSLFKTFWWHIQKMTNLSCQIAIRISTFSDLTNFRVFLMTLPAWHSPRGCDKRVWIWSPGRPARSWWWSGVATRSTARTCYGGSGSSRSRMAGSRTAAAAAGSSGIICTCTK